MKNKVNLTVYCGFFLIFTNIAYANVTKLTSYQQSLKTSQLAGDVLYRYAVHHHRHLPNANCWEAAVKPYWASLTTSSFTILLPYRPGAHLEMNKALSGKSLDSIANPGATMLLFESNSKSRNSAGTLSWENYSQCKSSSAGSRLIVFADGFSSSCINRPMLEIPSKRP